MEFKTANGTRYTITEIARELGVTRQTIYYWIKKGWVGPKRDYRNYPVFTKEDLKRIKKWYNSLHEAIRPATRPAHRRDKNVPPILRPKKQSEPPPNWKWGDLQNILYR